MSDRQEETIFILNAEQYDHDWPFTCETRLSDAIKFFQNKMEEIPNEYRKNAILHINSNSGYEDSHYAHIEISYTRPETDEEMDQRISIMKDSAR